MKAEKSNLKKANGFTLLEVLVAMAIFAVGMLAVASLQVNSLWGTARADTTSEAIMWATDRIEQLKALPYDDSLLTSGTHIPSSGDPINDTIYSASWTVTNNTTSSTVPVPNTKTVAVTITWNDAGETKTYTTWNVISDI
jgi:type IV pilus modification protein PilV